MFKCTKAWCCVLVLIRSQLDINSNSVSNRPYNHMETYLSVLWIFMSYFATRRLEPRRPNGIMQEMMMTGWYPPHLIHLPKYFRTPVAMHHSWERTDPSPSADAVSLIPSTLAIVFFMHHIFREGLLLSLSRCPLWVYSKPSFSKALSPFAILCHHFLCPALALFCVGCVCVERHC